MGQGPNPMVAVVLFPFCVPWFWLLRQALGGLVVLLPALKLIMLGVMLGHPCMLDSLRVFISVILIDDDSEFSYP